jgi:mRNA interferase RelE/StbE
LADDPHGPGCEKLSGQERYRVRQGVYRIVYEIEDDLLIVAVVKIGHRGQVSSSGWVMKRVMWIEYKGNGIVGPARIGWVTVRDKGKRKLPEYKEVRPMSATGKCR